MNYRAKTIKDLNFNRCRICGEKPTVNINHTDGRINFLRIFCDNGHYVWKTVRVPHRIRNGRFIGKRLLWWWNHRWNMLPVMRMGNPFWVEM